MIFYLSSDRYHVDLEEGFDNILVVDGVPIVDKSKLDKLITKISKEFSKKGASIKTDDMYVPWDDAAGKSRGYAVSHYGVCYLMTLNSYIFMEYPTADAASYAQSVMDGHPFDAKHTFLVNRFSDIDRYSSMNEEYREPEPEPYVPRVSC